MSITSALTALPGISPLPSQLGIVCARFKEPLEPWVPYAANTYLYSKGAIPQENDTVTHSSFRAYVELKNTGREGQTHLYHIVNHYDALEEIMIFSQANPFDLLAPAANTTKQMVEIALQVPENDVTPFNPTLFHDVADWEKIDWNNSKQALWIKPSQIASLKLASFTPGEFWTTLLGGCHPPAIRAMHGGTYAVRRETILKHPKAVYERALAAFEEANAVNPEVGFFMERMWSPLLSKKYWLKKVERP